MKTHTLLSAVGYARAPKATLFLRHPWKALTGWFAFRAVKKAVAAKPHRAAAVAAGAVAATAAVAAPFAVKAMKSHSKGEKVHAKGEKTPAKKG